MGFGGCDVLGDFCGWGLVIWVIIGHELGWAGSFRDGLRVFGWMWDWRARF